MKARFLPPRAVVVALCLLIPVASVRAQQTESIPHDDAAARTAWRKTMKKTPLPKHGCFMVKYPSTEWQEQPCTKAPNVSFLPNLSSEPQTVGRTSDFAAEATSGLISSAEGSFPNSGGLTSESGYIRDVPPAYPNSFSFQLNSNVFNNAPDCSGATNPSQCLGWQQFVFREANGQNAAIFIEYWLLNYGTACPSGWQLSQNSTNCYQNSIAVSVPAQSAASLSSVSVTGEAANGTDTFIFVAPGDTESAISQDSVLNLEQHWTEAEFNVFGDGGGGEANFSSGSTLATQLIMNNGATNAPLCLGPDGAGTTAETNNLSLIPQSAPVCCPYGGTSPSIQFLESNASGATATCGANGLESNIGSAPHSADGSATIITHPIIQGEIRVLYSAMLEDNTPGASISYQLFDSCGDSLGGATVSSGTTISYLDTEINGESCTYGIHGTMYATAPRYVPSLTVGITF